MVSLFLYTSSISLFARPSKGVPRGDIWSGFLLEKGNEDLYYILALTGFQKHIALPRLHVLCIYLLGLSNPFPKNVSQYRYVISISILRISRFPVRRRPWNDNWLLPSLRSSMPFIHVEGFPRPGNNGPMSAYAVGFLFGCPSCRDEVSL